MSKADIILQTKRLTIRCLQKSDIADLLPILNDSEVMHYIGGFHDKNEAKRLLNHWVADYQKDNFGFMAFLDKKAHHLIGYGGFLHQTVEEKDYIELGYCLAKAYWNQGFATEAVMALKEYGFTTLKFSQLISIIKKENIASRRVAEKCGMACLKKTIIDQELCCIYSAMRSSE